MMQKIIASIALRKINCCVAWLLAIAMVLIFLSGYALIGKISLIGKADAFTMHKTAIAIGIVLFILHASYGAILLLWQRKARKSAKARQ